MTREEVNHIIYDLTYIDYINQLKNKYGLVPKDYFYTNKKGELVKTGGITRGKDGLYIHHIYECFFLGLSNPIMYKLQCISEDAKIKDAQKAENLVYCNLLEHLILHIKIALEYHRGAEQVGIDFVTGDLNRLYELGDQNLIEKTYSASQHLWKQTVYDIIKNDYDIYVMLGKIIINTIGISKDLVCNVTFYNTCYQKLYSDLGEVDKSKIIAQIQNINYEGKGKSYREYENTMKQFIKSTDLDILYELLNHAYFISDQHLVIDKILSIDNSYYVFEKLSNYTQYDIREYIVSKSNCPISILEKLSNDKSIKVKVAIIKNSNTPKNVIDKLRLDKAKSIIKAIEDRNI